MCSIAKSRLQITLKSIKGSAIKSILLFSAADASQRNMPFRRPDRELLNYFLNPRFNEKLRDLCRRYAVWENICRLKK